MLISLNKIKEYVKIDLPTDELVKLIGSRLVEVEGTIDLAPKYQGIKVVKVVECEPIEGTHLHLCQVDAGTDVLIQVVCGAPNVHKGMLAAWIAPGCVVPATYGNENFRLDVRKLRGYDSHGMLAAADELDLGTAHDGVIEIDPRDAAPGDDLATVFDLNDVILDIENKSLTHRPDCFGLIGFAREVAGILGQKFTEPDFSTELSINNDITIKIADTALCPRYSCAVLDCTKLLEKGKYFTKQDAFLAKSGMRPISPIVDLTNILMLETGQPLHAFDYDKFVAVGGSKQPKILVRLAEPGEKLQLLDGKTITCAEHDILITSNNIPVALAGAMGGASTEIDASSTKIILESATFSLYNLRKTQMAHGIFSEAITRFTKGQPASQTLPVLGEAIRRLGTTPISVSDCYPTPAPQTVVKITTTEINNLLGTDYDKDLIEKTLSNVGIQNVAFAGTASARASIDDEPRNDGSEEERPEKATFEFLVPTWRTDIHIKEDLIEEVGRLLGFDNITPTLPSRSFASTAPNQLWQLKTTIRNILSDQLSAHELLTYSFVSGDLLAKVGEDPKNSYKIVNSISPELQYFRQSLTPSLLDKIHQNLKSGHQDFTIYEINQVAHKQEKLDQDGVPITRTHLSVITFGDFYQIKHLATTLADQLRISAPLAPASKGTPAYLEQPHSVATPLGHFGEVKKSILKKFKLDSYQISALEWDTEPILDLPKSPIALPALAFSKFPVVARDLTFRTPETLTYQQLVDTLRAALADEQLIHRVAPVSIYQKDSSLAGRSISFHLDFAHPAKTLQNDEISAIIERVTKKVTALGVEVA